MSDFDHLLSPEAIGFGIKTDTKDALFKAVAEKAASALDGNAALLQTQLLEREKMGSTGFGDGIAIPHGEIVGLDRCRGVLLRLAEPMEYDSIDGLPVDCVFALFSPKADGAEHLRALASISRRFRDARFVSKLRGARSADALYALMVSFEAADAA